ncbi:hypothetical protein OC861_006885 [Tilletia horrida]|nr:hypothetical protein OC861_006885 [Tilletia horrida]
MPASDNRPTLSLCSSPKAKPASANSNTTRSQEHVIKAANEVTREVVQEIRHIRESLPDGLELKNNLDRVANRLDLILDDTAEAHKVLKRLEPILGPLEQALASGALRLTREPRNPGGSSLFSPSSSTSSLGSHVLGPIQPQASSSRHSLSSSQTSTRSTASDSSSSSLSKRRRTEKFRQVSDTYRPHRQDSNRERPGHRPPREQDPEREQRERDS